MKKLKATEKVKKIKEESKKYSSCVTKGKQNVLRYM